MITQKQALQYLHQVKENHPQVFKRNFLFYGFVQTKGALDELKEVFPWVIALTTFIPLIYFISLSINYTFSNLSHFQAQAIAIICIMLLFMLILPIVIYQIRNSSTRLYTSIKNLPFKLALLIIFQAINLKFFESVLLQGILFFLSLSYGFIACYKENLFRSHSTTHDQILLNQLRKACFWSHIQIVKYSIKLIPISKSSKNYQKLLNQKNYYESLHKELMQFEDKFYQFTKYIDLESYVDELMK